MENYSSYFYLGWIDLFTCIGYKSTALPFFVAVHKIFISILNLRYLRLTLSYFILFNSLFQIAYILFIFSKRSKLFLIYFLNYATFFC